MAVLTFGGMLKFLREERGLSLRELGELADVDHTYIHRLESDQKEWPSDDVTARLVRSLKADERKARILRFLQQRPVDEHLIRLTTADRSIALEHFEAAAHMNFRGNRPRSQEDWRKILDQLRKVQEDFQS